MYGIQRPQGSFANLNAQKMQSAQGFIGMARPGTTQTQKVAAIEKTAGGAIASAAGSGVGGMMAGSAMAGAQAGGMTGPQGAAIGGAIGAVVGLASYFLS